MCDGLSLMMLATAKSLIPWLTAPLIQHWLFRHPNLSSASCSVSRIQHYCSIVHSTSPPWLSQPDSYALPLLRQFHVAACMLQSGTKNVIHLLCMITCRHRPYHCFVSYLSYAQMMACLVPSPTPALAVAMFDNLQVRRL